jgi:hypothetical protein
VVSACLGCFRGLVDIGGSELSTKVKRGSVSEVSVSSALSSMDVGEIGGAGSKCVVSDTDG